MGVETVELITQEQVDIHTAHVKDKAVKSQQPTGKVGSRSPISGTLDPYTGPWEFAQAAHLLRRAMVGPNKQQIEQAVEDGLNATVELLLSERPLPDPPINYFFEDDPFTPIGETWTDKPVTQEFIPYRRASLYAWSIGNMLEEGVSITEMMTLFWHNHFVTADIPIPKAVYQYITLLRTYATGNFRELTKDITLNPSMLVYLNGNQNTKFAPNENYARELLELFTVGKGQLAGPGDYTTFTEQDVGMIARILTGWRVRLLLDSGDYPQAFFNLNLHDVESKQLSHRFNNVVFANEGENEYKSLIDVIFEHAEASRHICRKLYRWFVYYKVDDAIEQNVIEPMAQILRDNDFEIRPVLEALLKSEHFYDVNSIGCIIKNPIEFIVANSKHFGIPYPDNILQKYALWNGLFRFTELVQMVYFFPPSVAGWKAFYQEPAYNQLWINSVTLIIRQLYTDVLTTTGFAAFDRQFRIDALEFISTIENALNPNALIAGIARIIYPNPLSQEQIDDFKETLIPGLPDFEWTVEYGAYLADPENEEIRAVVDARVRQLLRKMCARPEYHLG
jgi:hypothetical protein